LPNRSMNNLAKFTMLIWSATGYTCDETHSK
jgi:hypothetical protein